ncbi:MAG: RND family efflux transporter MFP subunit [Comamonadaceae bacterium]|nr:MAG: RND family efflux transporter MFP subunit [Comamonadaceae bacterium]
MFNNEGLDYFAKGTFMLRPHLATPLLFCALPLALVACGEKTSSTDPRTAIPLVRAALVQEASAATRSFTGTVVGFRVSGKVLERLVDAGQSVKRGQPLMRIDAVDLKLAAQAQQDAVAAARARARQTADDEARFRDLRGTGAISASSYDQVKAAADAAQAQLSAAEAQADVARNASRYTELVADGDGVVMDTLAELGQVVSAGQPVVRLAHAGRREAVIQLPETLRPAIGSAAQATLFDKDGMAVPAKLRQLSHVADRLTRTFEARYVLDGELSNAPLGSTVVIQISDGASSAKNGLNVPMGALFDAGKGPGVWVIKGEPTKVSWQPVAIQRMDDTAAYVAGQIKPGERIVALGAHLLRDGEQVRVAGLANATATQGARP